MPKKSSFNVPMTDFLIYEYAHITGTLDADIFDAEPHHLVLLDAS